MTDLPLSVLLSHALIMFSPDFARKTGHLRRRGRGAPRWLGDNAAMARVEVRPGRIARAVVAVLVIAVFAYHAWLAFIVVGLVGLDDEADSLWWLGALLLVPAIAFGVGGLMLLARPRPLRSRYGISALLLLGAGCVGLGYLYLSSG